MRVSRYCTAAVLTASILGAGHVAAAQKPEGPASFRVFLQGRLVGAEDVIVRRAGTGVIISGNGRLGAPLDFTTRRIEIRYDQEWRPQSLALEATIKGGTLGIQTTFANGQAENEVNQTGVVKRKTDTVTPDTIVLPAMFFGSYEALALRLGSIPVGSTFKVYVAPQAEIAAKETGRSTQRIETAGRVIDVRTYAVTFQNPGAPVDAVVWTDEAGRLLRFEVAAQSLLVVHEDLASVASRTQIMSRAGDQSVTVPANGFNLAGTLSQPSGSPNAKGRYPAVVLVAGSGFEDRDENIAGIPIFAQLASGLADAGYYVLRYDKRGTGQSGGREEAATIDDYAEDVRAAVTFLRERKDVDPKRVALFGHSEGAWVALVTAAKEEDNVAAVVVAGCASGTGGQLVLEQQSHLVEGTNLSPADRQARIDLQKHIQAAVVGETAWDGVPEPLRRQADTPWFRSFLGFSPGPVIARIKQPLLILQGTIDQEVAAHHAAKLGEMAKARKKVPAENVRVVPLDGVNHLLVQATTGELAEYPTLANKVIDQRIAKTTAEWLAEVLAKTTK
jgi:pimeloyl-ACP methyl ester carboxylesterase